jgi:predicted GNAT superfamily acetyltransferase
MQPKIDIREARERADYDACVSLQREVWGLSDLDITAAIQLIATVHAGGLLLVAETPGEGIIGFSYGFAGWTDGAAHLHSDMLAVRPSWRGRKVGLRLKWAQRSAALARGLSLVTWTFDPMRAKNARLNLRHLGAQVRELLPDLYGRTSSALHHGLATDRLLARWELTSPRVKRLAAQQPTPLPERPPLRLNEVRRQAGLPVSSEPLKDTGAPRLLLEIPKDWDAVCHADRGLALEWQGVVRRSLQAAFAQGYAAVDVAPGSGWRGASYVLDRVGEAAESARPSTRRASPKAAKGRKTTRSTSRRKAPRAARRRAARAGRGRR